MNVLQGSKPKDSLLAGQTNIDIAFSCPETRMRSTQKASLDRISVRDYVVSVDIGAFQAERGMTQRISFNVVLEVERPINLETDDVDSIFSYDYITQAIEYTLAQRRYNLLETLAEQIAEHILAHDGAQRIFVRIEKLDRGKATLGVEIERLKGAQAPVSSISAPKPLILYLGQSALSKHDFSAFLDCLTAQEVPAIICVQGARGVNLTENEKINLRLHCLDIEQQAWQLAAKDARCHVVHSHAELLWGLQNGQISLWAPSKLVFDTPNAPQDVSQLVPWFARFMQAKRIIAVGARQAPFADTHYDMLGDVAL